MIGSIFANHHLLFLMTGILALSHLAHASGHVTTNKSTSRTLLVVGDSLSAGFGIPKHKGWVHLLRERLALRGNRLKVVNASISGATSAAMKNRLPKLLQHHKPAITIIEIGANDGLRGLPLRDLQNNLDHMVQTCRRNNSKVLLIGMRLPSNYGPDYTRQFSQIYKTVAHSRNIALVPFLMEGIAAEMKWMQNDGIHPTTEAQPLLLRNVWPGLEKLL